MCSLVTEPSPGWPPYFTAPSAAFRSSCHATTVDKWCDSPAGLSCGAGPYRPARFASERQTARLDRQGRTGRGGKGGVRERATPPTPALPRAAQSHHQLLPNHHLTTTLSLRREPKPRAPHPNTTPQQPCRSDASSYGVRLRPRAQGPGSRGDREFSRRAPAPRSAETSSADQPQSLSTSSVWLTRNRRRSLDLAGAYG